MAVATWLGLVSGGIVSFSGEMVLFVCMISAGLESASCLDMVSAESTCAGRRAGLGGAVLAGAGQAGTGLAGAGATVSAACGHEADVAAETDVGAMVSAACVHETDGAGGAGASPAADAFAFVSLIAIMSRACADVLRQISNGNMFSCGFAGRREPSAANVRQRSPAMQTRLVKSSSAIAHHRSRSQSNLYFCTCTKPSVSQR